MHGVDDALLAQLEISVDTGSGHAAPRIHIIGHQFAGQRHHVVEIVRQLVPIPVHGVDIPRQVAPRRPIIVSRSGRRVHTRKPVDIHAPRRRNVAVRAEGHPTQVGLGVQRDERIVILGQPTRRPALHGAHGGPAVVHLVVQVLGHALGSFTVRAGGQQHALDIVPPVEARSHVLEMVHAVTGRQHVARSHERAGADRRRAIIDDAHGRRVRERRRAHLFPIVVRLDDAPQLGDMMPARRHNALR